MEEEIKKKKINWKPYIIAGIIALVIGVGIFLLFFLRKKSIHGALNGTSYAGIILIGVGGLIFVAKEGFFDFAAYGFKQMGAMLFGRVPNAYNDYPSYRDYKNEKRKKSSNFYLSFIAIGLLFLFTYLILKLL